MQPEKQFEELVISWQIGDQPRQQFTFVAFEQITIERYSRILQQALQKPEILKADKPDLSTPEAIEAYDLAFKSWLFGFCGALGAGDIPDWLAGHILPEDYEEYATYMFAEIHERVSQVLNYQPAPIGKFEIQGQTYRVPNDETVGRVMAGRAVRALITLESLSEAIKSGSAIFLSRFIAYLAFLGNELTERADLRYPVSESIIDQRAKLFLGLHFSVYCDLCFFLTKRLELGENIIRLHSTAEAVRGILKTRAQR